MVSWILLLCIGHSRILPSEALPVGDLSKSGRGSDGSGSEDDSEIEQTYVTSEHDVYRRLTSPRDDRSLHKKPVAYIRRGKLFNRNGYALRINFDGTVDGTTNKNSPQGNALFCCCFIVDSMEFLDKQLGKYLMHRT